MKQMTQMIKFRPETLEDLADHLLDNWQKGDYTFGYNDYDALATGSMMADMFLDEAKKYFAGAEQADIQWHAERIEELVDEGIYHLSSKHSDEPVSEYR
jgi:lysine/ornithine N-monooxygenase